MVVRRWGEPYSERRAIICRVIRRVEGAKINSGAGQALSRSLPFDKLRVRDLACGLRRPQNGLKRDPSPSTSSGFGIWPAGSDARKTAQERSLPFDKLRVRDLACGLRRPQDGSRGESLPFDKLRVRDLACGLRRPQNGSRERDPSPSTSSGFGIWPAGSDARKTAQERSFPFDKLRVRDFACGLRRPQNGSRWPISRRVFLTFFVDWENGFRL